MTSIKVNKGERVVITVGRKSSPSAAQGGRKLPKKLLSRPKGVNYEVRRRDDALGLIRIFDFGERVDGAPDPYYMYDLGVYLDSDLSPVPFTPGAGDLTAGYSSLKAQVLAVPEGELFEKFRHLTKTHPTSTAVGLSFSDDGAPVSTTPPNTDRFDSDGLRLKQSEVSAGFEVFGVFPYFAHESVTGQAASLKFTATPAYSADAVDFSPSKTMDIGLMPTLAYQKGRAAYDESGSLIVQHLNGFSATAVRNGRALDYSGGTYQTFYMLQDFMLDDPNARAFEPEPSPGPPYWQTLPLGSYRPASKFPAPPSTPPGPFDFIDVTQLSDWVLIPGGTLIAVIRKGGSFYYVWKN